MSISTILFDLDGTLLPMDQDEFVRAYFKLLAQKLAGHSYDPQALLGNIWKGVEAMVKNTGEVNNEEAFWRTFDAIYGKGVRKDIPLFEEYYRNESVRSSSTVENRGNDFKQQKRKRCRDQANQKIKQHILPYFFDSVFAYPIKSRPERYRINASDRNRCYRKVQKEIIAWYRIRK